MFRFLGFSLCLFCFGASSVQAENWPQFRGGEFNAVANDSFPQVWSNSQNVKWIHENPGEAWSAPIVWGNRVFLTAAASIPEETQEEPIATDDVNAERAERYARLNGNYRWLVYCLDAETGRELWNKTARQGKPLLPRHTTNTYATETPLTDGERVYAYFGMMGLFCYTVEGEFVWQKDLGTYEMRAGWGTASSPALADGKLFLQIDNEEQSFVVALDAKTGEEIWRQHRDEASQYSSPIVWTNSLRQELITVGQFVNSYDLATGQLLWKLDLQKGRSSATPLAVGDTLYVGNEFRNRGGDDDGGGYFFAIKAGGSGDITPPAGETSTPFISWVVEKAGLQMASPVFCQGYLYLLERRAGVLHCYEAATGKLAYQSRIPGAQAFWSSPWVLGDKVYCLDDDGNTHVIEAGPELNIVQVNSIPEQFWSSPAIANGSLYLRGAQNLYCIR